MCIVCRERHEQSILIRFQLQKGKAVEFSKAGRSSYVCVKCTLLSSNRLVKILNSKFKTKNKKIDEFGNIFQSKET